MLTVSKSPGFDEWTFVDHSVFLILWCLTPSNIVRELPRQQDNVFGTETIASCIDATSICYCIRILVFSGIEDFV